MVLCKKSELLGYIFELDNDNLQQVVSFRVGRFGLAVDVRVFNWFSFN